MSVQILREQDVVLASSGLGFFHFCKRGKGLSSYIIEGNLIEFLFGFGLKNLLIRKEAER